LFRDVVSENKGFCLSNLGLRMSLQSVCLHQICVSNKNSFPCLNPPFTGPVTVWTIDHRTFEQFGSLHPDILSALRTGEELRSLNVALRSHPLFTQLMQDEVIHRQLMRSFFKVGDWPVNPFFFERWLIIFDVLANVDFAKGKN
jgi:hypothetical protein